MNPASANSHQPGARLSVIYAVCISMISLLGVGCASSGHRTFDTPDAAAQGLVTAVRSNDTAALKHIFGPGSDDLVSSGDAVADRNRYEAFVERFDQKHQLVPGPDGSMTLQVGPDGWPLPIPIVQDESTGKWWFDTDAGRDEVIARRVGRNELDVIEVCKAIVDAQGEYAQADRNGDGIAEYAQKFISEKGLRNGLYWEAGPGEPESPLGPLVADAAEEGYATSANPSTEPRPYHGYCYRMLTAQGANAPGGQASYLADGKMTGGFAVVAHPADYGNSGITTFIVSHHGVIYQKDLGPDSERLARGMQAFDPGPGWEPAGLAPTVGSTPIRAP